MSRSGHRNVRRRPIKWYVDPNAAGSNNGTSWANAWTSLSAIVWGSILPGHTLYLSGGASSVVYSATALTVGASGSAGLPIVISGGIDPGHNGTAILDGATSTTIMSSTAIVFIGAVHDITIQNLTLQNCLENCLYIQSIASGTIIAQNLNIYTGLGVVSLTTNATTAAGNGTLHFAAVPLVISSNAASGFGINDITTSGAIVPPTFTTSGTATTLVVSPVNAALVNSGDTIYAGWNCRGIRIASCTGGTVIVRNCTLTTPAGTPAQTDAIFTAVNTAGTIQIYNNSISVANVDPTGHSDTWQSQQDTATINFHNNLLIHPNGGANNHGVIITDVGGTINVYNNIIQMLQSANIQGTPESPFLLQTLDTGFTGTCNIFNNTVYGGGNASIWIYEPNGFHATWSIKNNIFYTLPITAMVYDIQFAFSTPSLISQNLVFDGTTNLRASYINSSGTGWGAVRSTTSHAVSTGLWYFEYQYGFTLSSGNTMIAIANAACSLIGPGMGNDLNSVGYEWDNGAFWFNGTKPLTIQTSAVFQFGAVCVDLTNKKIWVKNLSTGSGWNNDVIGNQNPATNTGGFSLSTMAAGPYFVAVSVGGPGDHIVVNFGGASFIGAMPAGASAWGAATTLNPSDVAAPCVLTAPVGYLLNTTFDNFASWQAAGYDASGLQADPQFTTLGTTFTLQGSSPAINAGSTQASVPNDYLGYTRPQGTAYCLGAYEYPI